MRASGPGGQNVNKVASAVELRFDRGGAAASVRHARASGDSPVTGSATMDIVILDARRFRRRSATAPTRASA